MRYFFIFIFSIKFSTYENVEINQHLLFNEFTQKYKSEITNQCDTVQAHFNDKEAIDKINYLNKDFSTSLFSKYRSVGYWFCNAIDNENKRMNIGIISILFKNETDREIIENKIRSTKRNNFKVKLLTRFQLKASNCELLIIYSETVRNKSTATFFRNL